MRDFGRRVLGYGIASVAVGGLIYGGFIHESEADSGTLLGSAEVQLRLAMSMPAKDAQGRRVPAREELLGRIDALLDRVDTEYPDEFQSLELRAYLRYAQGDFGAAADLYSRTLEHPECKPDYRLDLSFNRAGALLEAGQGETALAELRDREASLATDDRARSRLRRAEMLMALNRPAEARTVALGVGDDEAVSAMRLMGAAHVLERASDLDAANSAYTRAAQSDPVANYYLARLKMRAGEIDTGLTLLERAVEAAGPRVRDLVRRDEGTWEPCAENDRFRNVMGSEDAAAAPGR